MDLLLGVPGVIGGGGSVPFPEISENARYWSAESGVTSSGTETLYTWATTRDNRLWGDWIGRDSVFTFLDGPNRTTRVMYGGWSNANVTSWNNQFITNEIWISEDGTTDWELIAADDLTPTTRPPKRHLGARCYATIDGVDYVYMMGGKLNISTSVPETVDVWRKPLGDVRDDWEQMTADAGVGARDNMFMGFLDGVLYAGGGYTGKGDQIGANLGVKEDLWKSTDGGANWTLVTATAPWGPTAAVGQEMLNRDGKLWLFGGWESTDGFGTYTCRNDVWTYDGTTFTEVLADGHGQWTQRFYHNVCTDAAGNFIIIGGHGPGETNVTGNGVWSADGVTWTALPTKPHLNIHACSLWSTSKRITIQNGYITGATPSIIFSLAAYTLRPLADVARVTEWTDGAAGLALTASSTARPYLTTGILATGRKTLYFNDDQYMDLASLASFSGEATVFVAGKFPNFRTASNQVLVGSAASFQGGIYGKGLYAKDSSSDSSMERAHVEPIQNRDLQCVAFTPDGTSCGMRMNGDLLLETDGEAFTLNGWSRIGGGYTATDDNLVGHIVAIAVIPDVKVTAEQFRALENWAYSQAGLSRPTYADESAIAPDQLLLQDNKLPHYSSESGNVHLLRDHSVDYGSGLAIPAFAPQNCATGDGTNQVTLTFGSYRPGKTAGPVEIEFSYKTPSSFSARSIASSYNNVLGNYHWIITQVADGKVNFYNYTHVGSPTVATTTALSTSTWYRLRFVRTGSAGNWTVSVYINGTLDATVSGVTQDPQSATDGLAYIFHGPISRLTDGGSVADMRLTHDGHRWYIPLTEGSGASLRCYRSDGLKLIQSVMDAALWAGVKTEVGSRCPNWLLNHGGRIQVGGSQVIGAYLDGISCAGAADDVTPDIFAGKFSNGTIHCDPTSVAPGGLGLETALTPTTERNTASSGLRRRQVISAHVNRLAAKATAMDSTTADNYFKD